MPHNRRHLLMSTSPPMAIGTPITTNIAVESSSDGCRKCGIIKKSGKRSCCARGGAWFKNCGDAGDPTKDHTWADGMEACNGLASSNPVKSMILLTVEQATNTIVLSNSTQNQKNMRRHRSHDGTTNSEESVALAKVAVRTCVLSIILRLQL